MVARGHVKNGVVVLEGDVCFPEGQEVTVLAPAIDIASSGKARHSILDIPSVSVGAILQSSTPDDDVLGEMLEGRR